MSRRLLVPISDDEHAWPALDYVLDFFPEADITLLHVIDPAGAGYGQRSDGDRSDGESATARTRAEELFERATERADEYGSTVDTVVEEGQPAQTIVEFAEDRDVDGIVLGTQNRSGVSRVLLGSVAETVAQQSPVSVTLVK